MCKWEKNWRESRTDLSTMCWRREDWTSQDVCWAKCQETAQSCWRAACPRPRCCETARRDAAQMLMGQHPAPPCSKMSQPIPWSSWPSLPWKRASHPWEMSSSENGTSRCLFFVRGWRGVKWFHWWWTARHALPKTDLMKKWFPTPQKNRFHVEWDGFVGGGQRVTHSRRPKSYPCVRRDASGKIFPSLEICPSIELPSCALHLDIQVRARQKRKEFHYISVVITVLNTVGEVK